MPAHYYDWKPISFDKAKNALEQGGKLFPLPTCFGNGGAVYRTGLETKRGACYLVSDFVKKGLDTVPANS